MLNRMRDWMKSVLGKSEEVRSPAEESDAPGDEGVASARAFGGEQGRDRHDDASTTGPGENGEFVGRVGGNDDVGAVGETGAEARARRDG
jgi:hypothetical protein